MRLPQHITPSSPIPHAASPLPLLRSPTSLTALTAPQTRRGNALSRASSSEPTAAGGLANWRRLPKKVASHTATTSTTSGERSGKRGRLGVGMGMQGTPARRGKRKASKPMGAHSTPATKIKSRSRPSSATNHAVLVKISGAKLQASSSSLDSSFRSSAEFLTPTPPSGIPDFSSPSFPLIHQSQEQDVFDSGYVARPRSMSSEAQGEWDHLIEEAEKTPTPRRPEVVDHTALYRWKEDVVWSVRGGSSSMADPEETERPAKDTADGDDTAQDETIYFDAMSSLNDRTGRSSPSSRARKRSSTITNRRSTPHKTRADVAISGESSIPRSTVQAPNVFGPEQEVSVYDADSLIPQEDATTKHLISMDVSLNDRSGPPDRSIGRHKRAKKIRERKSTPHKSSSQPLDPLLHIAHSPVAGTTSQKGLIPSASKHSFAKPVLPPTYPKLPARLLSEILQSTQPDRPSEGQTQPSSLWASTQDSGLAPAISATRDDMPSAPPATLSRGDRPTKLAGMDRIRDEPPEYSRKGSRRTSTSAPIAMECLAHDHDSELVDGRPADFAAPSSDGYDPALDPDMPADGVPATEMWFVPTADAIPVPFTPSSRLSPASLSAPSSLISFPSRSPSLQRFISPAPTHTLRTSKKIRTFQSTRKGAWRGAEVLARMEAADRASARYHIAFDPSLPVVAEDVAEGEATAETRATARKRTGSGTTASPFEVSEEELALRQRRLDHCKELEVGYRFHVELVL